MELKFLNKLFLKKLFILIYLINILNYIDNIFLILNLLYQTSK